MNSQKNLKLEYLPLLIICIAAFSLYIFNINFDLYFHGDEIKKFKFVLLDTQDFKHPILMLQLARVANFFFQETELDNIAIICRMVSAVSATALIIATHFISRDFLQGHLKWLVPLGVAFSPILVVHAHYFKEDMVFVVCTYTSILFYLKYLDCRSKKYFTLFSIALGLALAAQYKAIILLPLFFLFPFLDKRVSKEKLYRYLSGSFLFAAIVALLINYPAIQDYSTVLEGIRYETDHVTSGHSLRWYPIPNYFSFHLRNSLLPGMTELIVSLSLVGLLHTMIKWQESCTALRFLVIYTLVFYFAHEITPMKAAPGYMRYMIPIVPALVIFSVQAVYLIRAGVSKLLSQKHTLAIIAVISAIIVLSPLIKSSRLVYNFSQYDTRSIAKKWATESNAEILAGWYTLRHSDELENLYRINDRTINARKLEEARARGYQYLMLSSFNYERFLTSLTIPDQESETMKIGREYQKVFSEYSYIEIQPTYQTFAFSNPVIRILDLSSKASTQ